MEKKNLCFKTKELQYSINHNLTNYCYDWGFTTRKSLEQLPHILGHFNPIALKKAKTAYNFGLSECNSVKVKDAILKVAALLFSFLPPSSMGVNSYMKNLLP